MEIDVSKYGKIDVYNQGYVYSCKEVKSDYGNIDVYG